MAKKKAGRVKRNDIKNPQVEVYVTIRTLSESSMLVEFGGVPEAGTYMQITKKNALPGEQPEFHEFPSEQEAEENKEKFLKDKGYTEV